MNTTGVESLYWLVAVDVANRAATLATTTGARAFPLMSPQGGVMLDIPALVSDQIPDGELHLLDASAVAANSDTVTLGVSRVADIEMDDAPTNESIDDSSPPSATGASLVSMFQTNSAALLATVFFGCEAFRPASTKLTGVAWAEAT